MIIQETGEKKARQAADLGLPAFLWVWFAYLIECR